MFDNEGAEYLTIKIKTKTLDRIDVAVASGVLPFRTRVEFLGAALRWALESFEAESQLTVMGLMDEE
jgi:hypothetical protein